MFGGFKGWFVGWVEKWRERSEGSVEYEKWLAVLSILWVVLLVFDCVRKVGFIRWLESWGLLTANALDWF